MAVAEREVAARGSAVAAEARALVEHQVGPARGRENRPRGLPAVGMAEELIPAWEHHGDTLALGEAQALVGRPLGPAVADRRLHAGRHCDRREEIGRGRADLERDAPAERLARDHDLPVPTRALRLDLLQHALFRAPIRIRALGEVVAVELEHVPAAGLEQAQREGGGRGVLHLGARDPVVPEDHAAGLSGPKIFMSQKPYSSQ